MEVINLDKPKLWERLRKRQLYLQKACFDLETTIKQLDVEVNEIKLAEESIQHETGNLNEGS